MGYRSLERTDDLEPEEHAMGERDEIISRTKQAVGDPTGDADLTTGGKRDQALGGAEHAIRNAEDTAQDTVDNMREKLS